MSEELENIGQHGNASPRPMLRDPASSAPSVGDAGPTSGYRRTELGFIPADWEVRPLHDVVEFLDGRRRPVKDTERAKMRGDVPYYGASGVVDYVNAHLFDEDLILLGEDGENILSRNCRLAFKISGKTWVNNHAHVLRPKAVVKLEYLVEYLESRNYEQYNTGTAQPKLNKAVCSGLPVVCPPLHEQRAIAEALSDVDALLGALDRLIAKKRDLKQAAMQQLLTGQIRLPGFASKAGYRESAVGAVPVDWDVQPMSELTSLPIQNGVFCEPRRKGRGQGLVNVSDLYGSLPLGASRLELFDATQEELRRFGVFRGDIFFTRSSLTPEGIAHCNVYDDDGAHPATFDCHIIRVRPASHKIDPFFLFRSCQGFAARKYFVLNAKTTTMTTIDQSVVANLPVPVPPLLEQKAIADVLSVEDNELAVLEKRRAKTRDLKQGMMQALLTGRIRLV